MITIPTNAISRLELAKGTGGTIAGAAGAAGAAGSGGGDGSDKASANDHPCVFNNEKTLRKVTM